MTADRMNATIETGQDIKDTPDKKQGCKFVPVNRLLLSVIILVLLAALAVTLVLLLTRDQKSEQDSVQSIAATEAVFRFASVASSTNLCSQVGTNILGEKGGSAVDAAIAALVCVGVVRFHSSGVGGDSFWTIYDKKEKKAFTILARSRAPLRSNSTIFINKTSAAVEGGLSVAVPGEVMAFWEAHKRFGLLPWSDLFEPAIRLAEEGFPLEASTASAIKSKVADGTIGRFKTLRDLLTNPETHTWYQAGEKVRNPALAKTLRKIATGNATDFYNGSLAEDMVKEINEAGGIITLDDFAAYHAPVTDPLSIRLYGNLTVYSPPLPSGGAVMLYILNILSGYNMSEKDLATQEKTILTYHRHLEAFKHAYALRSKLGGSDGEDANFVNNMQKIERNVTSSEQGEAIRHLISDTTTFPWQSYNPAFEIKEDNGTSHLSVLGQNGDAVSVTSTINHFFGSKIVGNKTGIIYNNMMDDFSVPGVTNGFGVKPSPSNFIKPGKRPLSSMAPTIVVDQSGTPVLVVGAAGGTRITTTTAFLTSMTMWLDKRMKPAMDAPRIHHQLLPNEVVISSNAPDWLLKGLRQKGHVVVVTSAVSTPTGILQKKPGQIFADAPGFIVDGF